MSTSRHSRRRLSRFDRFKRLISRHRTASIAYSGVILVALTSGVAYAIVRSVPTPAPPPAPRHHPVAPQPAPQPKYYAPLTGEPIKDPAAATRPVTAIMIENSPAARPQSGLGQAEIVYEAIAEGGITRFLALYQQHKPSLVGPVRSVRMYFVDWLAPYNASIFHVGGSLYALREIRNGHYRDLDQFFYSNSYWRSNQRYAPHNVYTNFKRIDALNKAKGYRHSKPAPFLRADTTASQQPTAQSIDITISSAAYNSHYDYNAKTNLYRRSQGGQPHTDTLSGQITARVVIVMKTDMHPVMQDGIREDYRTTGSGKAWVFQDGMVYPVTWHKKDRQHQLSFTDKHGKPFALARGTTWISVIPNTREVTWR